MDYQTGGCKRLLNNKMSLDELTDGDFYYEIQQKGVDIRLGLDVASLAYKRLVTRIILVTGDSDFVPAAKVGAPRGCRNRAGSNVGRRTRIPVRAHRWPQVGDG